MKRGLTAHISRPLTARLPTSTRNNGFNSEITKVELAESVPSTGNAPTNPTFISGTNLLKNVEKYTIKAKNFWKKARGILNYTLLIMAEEQSFDEFDHSHMGKVLRRQWLGDKHTSISLHRDGKSES